ncbi:MAG: rRNA pseudouridine synthase [Chlamydiae bacterium]|nr:rRNA pseudouridine synthase [Chlamydiota bacterium]
MEKQRLSKILAAAGVASRRGSELLIFSGKVTVNGKLCLVPQTLVNIQVDEIRFEDRIISSVEKKVSYVLNKPVGYICTNTRNPGKKIVLDLFESRKERLFTVGRLDRDTSGLLIVTNDGLFAHKLIHPSSNIVKEYLVKTNEEISHDHLSMISKGALVEGKWVKPVKVHKVRRGTLKISVQEGRKREVRIFIEQTGVKILSLCRIRIGGLHLGSLKEGVWRKMTEKDKQNLLC